MLREVRDLADTAIAIGLRHQVTVPRQYQAGFGCSSWTDYSGRPQVLNAIVLVAPTILVHLEVIPIPHKSGSRAGPPRPVLLN
jgi:hypothetical protein